MKATFTLATLLAMVAGPAIALATVPLDAGLNVADYGATPDDDTDDTAAIQAALDERNAAGDQFGKPVTVVLPEGEFIISDTLSWEGCCLRFQGQGSDKTTIRLVNNAPGFDKNDEPKAMIRPPREEGNKSFRQYVNGVELVVGTGNPGAVGIDFISSNSGSVYDVHVRSEGAGRAGIFLTRAWPGPLLVSDVVVEGFDVGIEVDHPEYAPTIIRTTLRGQAIAGIRNSANILPIRRLTSENDVPAIVATNGAALTVLLDSELRGGDGGAALLLEGNYLLRNVLAEGYDRVVQGVEGLQIDEAVSREPTALFEDSPSKGISLEILETPVPPEPPLNEWVLFTPNQQSGMQARDFQNKLDSGAEVIYLRHGSSLWGDVLTVPSTVKRIVGHGHVINNFNGEALTLDILPGDEPLHIEGFGYGLRIRHASARTLVLRQGNFSYEPEAGAGDVFMEDTEIKQTTYQPGQRIWAAQYNTEGDPWRVVNHGADLWILGIKTEGRGTVITTEAGGRTELLGGLIYPTITFDGEFSETPAFASVDGAMSLTYATSSYVERGRHPIQVLEERAGDARKVMADAVSRSMPLFVGYLPDDAGESRPVGPASDTTVDAAGSDSEQGGNSGSPTPVIDSSSELNHDGGGLDAEDSCSSISGLPAWFLLVAAAGARRRHRKTRRS